MASSQTGGFTLCSDFAPLMANHNTKFHLTTSYIKTWLAAPKWCSVVVVVVVGNFIVVVVVVVAESVRMPGRQNVNYVLSLSHVSDCFERKKQTLGMRYPLRFPANLYDWISILRRTEVHYVRQTNRQTDLYESTIYRTYIHTKRVTGPIGQYSKAIYRSALTKSE